MLSCLNKPGGNKAREIGLLIIVNATVSLQNKASLFTKGSNDTDALYCLVEVAIDGWATDCFQPSQLTGCHHVEILETRIKQKLKVRVNFRGD